MYKVEDIIINYKDTGMAQRNVNGMIILQILESPKENKSMSRYKIKHLVNDFSPGSVGNTGTGAKHAIEESYYKIGRHKITSLMKILYDIKMV